jgi:hypothetical protein
MEGPEIQKKEMVWIDGSCCILYGKVGEWKVVRAQEYVDRYNRNTNVWGHVNQSIKREGRRVYRRKGFRSA